MTKPYKALTFGLVFIAILFVIGSMRDNESPTIPSWKMDNADSFAKITDIRSMQGATSYAFEKVKQALNIFKISSLPLFVLQAPEFKLVPLEKLPTYHIEKLPQNKEEVKTSKTLENLPYKTAATNSLTETLATFKPKISSPEDSAVNIFCSQRIGTLRKVITGSGVLINRDGTVLTNAHVAQYPLVAEKETSVVCIARTGATANKTYSIKTVFISPEWSTKNAAYINTGGTQQTGEHDYALLKITSSDGVMPTPMPITYQTIGNNSPVTLVAYPADVLASSPQANLTRQSENLSLVSYYSLGQGSTDAFQTSTSKLAQRGSSGGLVANSNNDLIGIVSIVTQSTNGSGKQIRGITASHINNSISKYIPDGLLKASKEGSAEILSHFNQNYRTNLTDLYLKNLTK